MISVDHAARKRITVLQGHIWSSMQIELLDRKKWNTCVELANAMFEYIEIFYNRPRKSLGWKTPNTLFTTLLEQTHHP